MSNPYEPSPTSIPSRSRWFWVRWLLAAPFWFYGTLWTLMSIRTGHVVREAMVRYDTSGQNAVVGDLLFYGRLWRATVIPVMGIGALLVAVSIVKRHRVLGLFGAAWIIVAFFGVEVLIRWLFA